MAGWHVLLVFVVVIGTARCSSCDCDGPDTDNAQTCESLLRVFEDALLSDGGNIYKLRNLLYPSTTAPPELANITYHLQFTNATGGSVELPDSSGELPSCFCPDGDASNRTLFNTSGIIPLRYGWTIIGIYTIIQPALLHQLQLQLPFAIMRGVLPDGVPFLWNGYNQLPSTSFHLTISTDNLTCLPGHSEVDGVLKRLTSYLKQYARSGRAVGGGKGNLAEVDYVLNGQFVSNIGEIPNSSCVGLNIYLVTSIGTLNIAIIYVTIFALWVIVSLARWFIKEVARVDHQSIPFVIGFLICMTLFGMAVTLTELITFPWDCLSSIIVSYKLLLPFSYSFFFMMFCICFLIRCRCSFKVFVVLIYAWLSIFIFLCFLISLLPTLLLGFAYPHNVFPLVVLHVAFVYAVTVAFAAGLGDFIFWWNLHYTNSVLATVKKLKKREMCAQVFPSIVSICFILFISSIGYAAIMKGYSLTVVRGFVSTDGVNAVVSLIPSLVLFLISWLIKRRFFADAENYSELVRKIVYKLILLPSLSTPHSRMNLGKELGIPVSKLETIEFETPRRSDTIQQKKTVLGRMMSYWFEKNNEASLEELVNKLDEMNLDPQGTCTRAIRDLAASLAAAGGSRPPATRQRPQVSSATRRRESEETQPLLTGNTSVQNA